MPRLRIGENNLIKIKKINFTFNNIWAVAEKTLKMAIFKQKPITFCLATFDKKPTYQISRTKPGPDLQKQNCGRQSD